MTSRIVQTNIVYDMDKDVVELLDTNDRVVLRLTPQHVLMMVQAIDTGRRQRLEGSALREGNDSGES